MKITVKKGKYCGTVKAPPSKSAAHRLLICAGLAEGESIIHGISESEDMKATLDCLSSLGAKYEKNGDSVKIVGVNPFLRRETKLYCRESGSTLRFFIPICMLSEKEAVLTGSKTLLSRPLDVYGEIATEQGIDFEKTDDEVLISGALSSGYFKVRGDISSQFISGLMFALPLLEGYSVIELIPPIASRSYIDMTVQSLLEFGVKVEFTEDNKIIVPGGQKYKPTEVFAEGDWSNAAFFLALDGLNNDVDVTGIHKDTLQGDSVIRKLLPRLARTCPTIDIDNCPDLAPIIMAYAAAANGCELIGTDRLKIKESDRGQAMAEELAKFGVKVKVGENRISVVAPSELTPPNTPIHGHNDHRIVMACAILLTLTGGEIEGAEAVNKSYPNFFEDLSSLIKSDL